jgi:hypothetical protein
MDYKEFLVPLASAGFQVTFTFLSILISIILLSKTAVGKELLNGVLKEKDHESEYKFSMGRLLLLFTLIMYFTLVMSFRNMMYDISVLDDKNFLTTIDNIEGYGYKIVDFFMILIFGNKILNVWAAIKTNGGNPPTTPPPTPIS